MVSISVEDILVNHNYSSPRGQGLIINAEKREDMYSNSANYYAILVRPTNSAPDFWATVKVFHS